MKKLGKGAYHWIGSDKLVNGRAENVLQACANRAKHMSKIFDIFA